MSTIISSLYITQEELSVVILHSIYFALSLCKGHQTNQSFREEQRQKQAHGDQAINKNQKQSKSKPT